MKINSKENKLKKDYIKLKKLNPRSISIIEYISKIIKTKDKICGKKVERYLIYTNLYVAVSKKFEDSLVEYLLNNNLMTKQEIISIAENAGKENFKIHEVGKRNKKKNNKQNMCE